MRPSELGVDASTQATMIEEDDGSAGGGTAAWAGVLAAWAGVLAAAATATSWSNLPRDLIESVLDHLPCLTDRVRVGYINRHWRAVVKDVDQPRQLPWLLLPSTSNPVFYSTVGDCMHKIHGLPEDVKRARISGSSEGGWLFLAGDGPDRHVLYNINSGRRIDLPITMVVEDEEHYVDMIAAVVSGSPVVSTSPAPTPGTYVVGAIVTPAGDFPRMAVWMEPMDHWVDCGASLCYRTQQFDMILEDVTYHSGCFYYLTSDEGVIMLVPDLSQEGKLRMRRVNYQVDKRPDFDLDEDMERQRVHELFRYLAESDGHLLMVVKYVGIGRRTVLLRIFKLLIEEDEQAARRVSWAEQLLPGQIVFVGHACSRCYKTITEDHLIYFLDDREEKAQEQPKLFRRDDMGTFSQLDLQVNPWPPLVLGGEPLAPCSDSEPPTWWLH